MSIKSWKKEFYSTSAYVFECSERRYSIKEALKHSIRKWKGLSKANLKKHGLKRPCAENHLEEDGVKVFSVDAYTCSLCNIFKCGICECCPIAMNIVSNDKGCMHAYEQFVEHGRVGPMLKRLNNALRRVQK